MAYYALLLVSFLIVASITADDSTDFPAFNGKIKHVIAIMFENRSFDHMIGFLRSNRTDIDGCIPEMGLNCSNPLTSNTSSPDNNIYYTVSGDAVYIQPGDPDHSVGGTTLQLYGDGVSNLVNTYPSKMNGFIESYNNAEDKSMHNDSGQFIMQCFTPKTVPIISTLANEFALYDTWFADFPGCTDPNRLFSWLGTSGGMASNIKDRLWLGFNQMSIFELLDKELPLKYNKNDTWRLYFEQTSSPLFLNYVRLFPEKLHWIDEFLDHVTTGDLPLFSWIDPAYNDLQYFPASDQHPDHDVTQGEKLMKKIYETLRVSPIWNETLLMIFYDEHGGFYDHVSPPLAPNPDNINSTDPEFNFNRLGLRVPTLFISPWIKKGTIGKRPDSPNGSQYCHSSLVHTMREQFMPHVEALTKRDEWSLTFDDVINLDEMRKDCPITLPNVPDSGIRDDTLLQSGKQPTTEWIQSLVAATSSLCNVKLDNIDQYLVNQDTAGNFLINCMKQFMNRK